MESYDFSNKFKKQSKKSTFLDVEGWLATSVLFVSWNCFEEPVSSFFLKLRRPLLLLMNLPKIPKQIRIVIDRTQNKQCFI